MSANETEALEQKIDQLDERIAALEQENKELRAALTGARGMVQHWAAYAADYDAETEISQDLAKIDAALAASK